MTKRLMHRDKSKPDGARSVFRLAIVAAIAVACSLLAIPASRAAIDLSVGDFLFTDWEQDAFWHVDESTGAKTFLSSGSPVAGATAVALDGTIYAAVGEDGDQFAARAVVRIDPVTGVQTVIADGFESIFDLAVEPGGALLAADSRKGLVRIDPDSGTSTVNDGDWHDLALAPDGRILGLNSRDGIWEIDPITGDAAFVARPRGRYSSLLRHIAVDGEGALLVSDDAALLWRVDPTTGTFALVEDFAVGDINDIAVEATGTILMSFRYVIYDDDRVSGVYRMDAHSFDRNVDTFSGRKLLESPLPKDLSVVEQIDTRPPTAILVTPETNGAYRPGEAIIANYVCVDQGTSGMLSCDGTVPDGEPIDTAASRLPARQFSVTAIDRAGNQATVTHSYLIDGDPPTISITSPSEGAVYEQNDIVFSDYSCSDATLLFAGSGVDTCTSEDPGEFDLIHTATLGRHTFTVAAVDRAGNRTIASRSYSVIASGNAPPEPRDLSILTLEDTGVDVVLNASDPEGSTLTYAIESHPAFGHLAGSPPNVRYVPAANYFGGDRFTYSVDDGAGGIAIGTVTIKVRSVNDAPSFRPGTSVAVQEDTHSFSAQWATAISAGPADEFDQVLEFQVSSNTDPSLFSTGPVIDRQGVLSFAPAPNAAGTSTITVRLFDGGGTANGGTNLSLPTTFTITVHEVNDIPVVAFSGGVCLSETAGQALVALRLSDVETDASELSLAALSSNQTLLPDRGVAFERSGADRGLRLTTTPGRSGVSDLRIMVADHEAVSLLQVKVIVGTSADDVLTGSNRTDVILGLDGVDGLTGLDGGDLICGGTAADSLGGGLGDDSLSGGLGDDRLHGDAGDDQLLGGDGSDQLAGGEGDDSLTGGRGADSFSGGAGVDSCTDFKPTQGDTRDATIP